MLLTLVCLCRLSPKGVRRMDEEGTVHNQPGAGQSVWHPHKEPPALFQKRRSVRHCWHQPAGQHPGLLRNQPSVPGGYFSLCSGRVVQIYMVGRHLHEADISQVHICCVERQKTNCHEKNFPDVSIRQSFLSRAQKLSASGQPLPVYWMNISSRVGS